MKSSGKDKQYLLLSADGDISLYAADSEILDRFDELLEAFFKWKKTACYDETLFVEYLKRRMGNDSISYCKKVGTVGGRLNVRTGRIEDDIEEEYRNVKWYNF